MFGVGVRLERLFESRLLRTCGLFLALLPGFALPSARAQERCGRIEVFAREGCPHCDEAKRWLADFASREPGVDIEIFDVARDRAARERLRALAEAQGIETPGVPAFLLCGELSIGFADAQTSGRSLEARLAPATRAAPDAGAALRMPWIGELSVARLGLPLFTLALGLVDGLNPCATWVLLFLLSILVNLHDRRRMLVIAGAFVLVSGVAYYAFMAAWLNVFLWIGYSRAIQFALGGFALLAGAIHLKDALRPGSGLSLSIPERAKPGLYVRVRAILRAENLRGALLGAVVLAVFVNSIELLCTAGLPALYTQILGQQGLTWAGYHGYLLLYDLAYMADDAVLVAVAVAGLQRYKLQPAQARGLQALSGSVMAALGLLLLLRPDWLMR